MQQKHSYTLKGLDALSAYKDMFVDVDTLTFDPKELIEGIESSFDYLIGSTSQYKVTFHNDLISFRAKEEFFHNYIKKVEKGTRTYTQIVSVLNLKNKNISAQDFPFRLDDEAKSESLIGDDLGPKIDRYREIFKTCGITLEKTVMKSYATEDLMKSNPGKRANDLLRVYYQTDPTTNNLKILLLDVHHLIAESDYKPKYLATRSFGVCLTMCIQK